MIGRFQLGQTLSLLLLTVDGSGTPQVPLVPPWLKIWQGASLILKAEMPIIERFKQTGLFLARVFLGPAFTPALYEVEYTYQIDGSYNGVVTDNFEIMPGGNADGNVMSMYFYDRPQAQFIVQSLDSGKIVQGRNPTL